MGLRVQGLRFRVPLQESALRCDALTNLKTLKTINYILELRYSRSPKLTWSATLPPLKGAANDEGQSFRSGRMAKTVSVRASELTISGTKPYVQALHLRDLRGQRTKA